VFCTSPRIFWTRCVRLGLKRRDVLGRQSSIPGLHLQVPNGLQFLRDASHSSVLRGQAIELRLVVGNLGAQAPERRLQPGRDPSSRGIFHE
jgi:hypothetical protein